MMMMTLLNLMQWHLNRWARSIFAEDLQPIPEHVCHKDDVAETASSAPAAQTVEEEELEQEEVVEEAIIPRSPKMDTHGKPIGRLNLNKFASIKIENYSSLLKLQYTIRIIYCIHTLHRMVPVSNTHRACCMPQIIDVRKQKQIGQWYLPPGFDGNPVSESADESETGPDEPEIDLNDADERSLRLAFAALKAQSNTSATCLT